MYGLTMDVKGRTLIFIAGSFGNPELLRTAADDDLLFMHLRGKGCADADSLLIDLPYAGQAYDLFDLDRRLSTMPALRLVLSLDGCDPEFMGECCRRLRHCAIVGMSPWTRHQGSPRSYSYYLALGARGGTDWAPRRG
jgi:hypothetical protein